MRLHRLESRLGQSHGGLRAGSRIHHHHQLHIIVVLPEDDMVRVSTWLGLVFTRDQIGWNTSMC